MLDVTADSSLAIDWDCTIMAIACPHGLPSVVEIDLWGPTIYPSGPDFGSAVDIPGLQFDPKGEAVFAPSQCRVSFEKPSRLEIYLALYHPGGSSFLLDEENQFVTLERRWAVFSDSADYIYNLGGVLDWPRSDCQIEVMSAGLVTLTLDPITYVPGSRAGDCKPPFRRATGKPSKNGLQPDGGAVWGQG